MILSKYKMWFDTPCLDVCLSIYQGLKIMKINSFWHLSISLELYIKGFEYAFVTSMDALHLAVLLSDTIRNIEQINTKQ